ncbi:BTB/POZ domain-containing protein 18 isoform X4 [Pogona vitticeps]|uniref:BTB/POZ domain-containing protein 18 n=1 Tax=Pogona vitticeps TaxID=103695 RepID=A0A6J0TK68_9SAUR|nr:BTB/POZ domain-containing protein 18 [Pogona vitticeps]
MSSQAPNSKILYRNSRLLRMVFLQLHHQQRADLFCDVVLQAEGEAVPAHCCILSACSPFFTERLERERPPKGHKVVLEIQGLKIGTLRKLVDFLYTSEMEVSREEAQDILAAARQLQRDVFKCSDPYFHEVVPNSSFPHTPTPSVYGEHSEEQMAQRTE